MAAPMPTVIAECSFTTNPAAAPSWTAISAYARGFNSRRGRQFELNQMDTGVATLRLNNQDRRFDPTFVSSPYYPNVKPMKRVRLRATWASQTYDVFAGYAERWPQEWELHGKLAEIQLPMVDALAVFGYVVINTTYLAGLTGARVNDLLTSISWGSGLAGIIGDATYGLLGTTFILGPAGDRAIDLGRASIASSTLVNTTALEHLQAVARSENGLFFVGKDGSAVFRQRQFAAPSSMATFGDSAPDLPYSDLVFEEAPIWNEIRLTGTGAEQVQTDATSQAAYFRRSNVQSGYLQASDSDLAALAGWQLTRFKDPTYRVSSMVVQPQKSPAVLWPQVLGREIGDCITIKRQPPGAAGIITQVSVIEGIEHEVTPETWTTRFWLSAADTNMYLIIDNAIAGRIGIGSLGY
jgi:hypothetical protein